MKKLLIIASVLGTLTFAEAMVVDSKLVKKQSSFVKNKKQKLFDFLDLNQRDVRFTSRDISKCRRVMIRAKNSLKYSCTLEIPGLAKTSQLSNHKSARVINVYVGRRQKDVEIRLAKNAKTVQFLTEIEDTGLDFEEASFNADLLNVLGNSAHQLIAQAMKQRLTFQVLEN